MNLIGTQSILATSIILLSTSCNKEPTVAPSSDNNYLEEAISIDEEEKILLYNGDGANLPQEKLYLGGDEVVLLVDSTNQITLGEPYDSEWRGNSYTFYRTELPIIKVNTRSNRDVHEVYESSQFALIENGQVTLTGDLGIKLRGNTSLSFPKKSYRIELWEDSQGLRNRDASIFNMRSDDDWLLDGMWNEPLSVRDKSAMELWLNFGRVHYADEEEDVVLGAAREYCELFINGSYQGLYYIGERLDRKQLKLETYTDSSNGGELYKAKGWDKAVIAFSLPEFDNNNPNWGGYEIKYPEEVGTYDWGKLKEFIKFFKGSIPNDFDETYSEKIDVDNIVDYFIFINLLSAYDNNGNNIYVARRNQASPYYFVSWDYDATLGLNIFGKELTRIDDFLHHVVTRKLIGSATFRTKLKARWEQLRSGILESDNIKSYYRSNYAKLLRNGVYEREGMIFRLEKASPDSTAISYLERSLDERLQYLDKAFREL